MRQIPLAIAQPPQCSFENYLPGENRAALEHLMQLAPHSAPAYLWGPAGSGKTHLLLALAAGWQERGERVAWFGPTVSLPWAFDERASLIVFDDCDGLDAEQQHAAFALFVQASTVGVTVISAGALPPVDLPLREDLRTRLGWGLVFALQPLSESEARAVLRREADRRGIRLTDEVLDYLLTRFARDLTQLMALLDRLDEFALASRRAVTVPLLKKMLEEEGA
ncbi:MAG: DnaA regulatory inactivator Hda [Burkholderiales bacterium]